MTLPNLPQGSYLVVWRVISREDAHAVGGAFSFGVSIPPDTAAAAEANVRARVEPDFTTHLIRYLGLLAQAVMVGAVIFRWLVWGPARAGTDAELSGVWIEQRRYFTLLADILRAALIIGVLGALYLQAQLVGAPFWGLFPTRWGVIWLARAAAAFLAAGWMESLLLDDRSRRIWLGLSLGAILLLTTAFTSHGFGPPNGSSARPGLAAPLASAVHLLATSAWVGGLVTLTLTLLTLRALDASARGPLAAEVVGRFSGVAASVGLIVVSGLTLSRVEVRSWAGLLLTDYGRTLMVKLVVVSVAFGLGVYNSFGARRGPDWGSVGVEAALTLGAIFAAAVLTNLPPPTAAANSADRVLERSGQAAGMNVLGQVRPARVGPNAFEIASL